MEAASADGIDGLEIAPAEVRNSNFSDVVPPGLQVVTFDQAIRNCGFDVISVANRRNARMQLSTY